MPGRRFEILVHRLTRHQTHNRALWVTGCTIVFFLCALFGLGLETRLDRDDFLPDTVARHDAFDEAVLARLGTSDRVVLYLDSSDSIDVSRVGPFVDELAQRLRLLESVRNVQERTPASVHDEIDANLQSRLALYLAPYHLRTIGERISRTGIESVRQSMSMRDTVNAGFPSFQSSNDPLGVVGIVLWTLNRIRGGSPVLTVNGYYTVSGGRKLFLVVDLDSGVDNIQQTRDALDAIALVVEEARADKRWSHFRDRFEVSIIGRPVSYVGASDTLQADIRRTGIAATVVVVVLLILFFRSLAVVLAVLAPTLFGLAVAAATGFFVFGGVSVMSLIFIGALIGLGVDFGIHVANHYRHLGGDRVGEDLLAFAIARPGRAIIFGALTSVAAFVSLGVMSYPVTQQVAVLASTGIVATLLGTFTILPVALLMLQPKPDIGVRWPPLAGLGKRGAIFWLLLLAAMLPAISVINFEPHPWQLALRGNPKSAEMNALNSELGVSLSPLLMVSRGSTPEEAIERDRRAVELLRVGAQRAEVVSIESLSNWVPSRSRQQENASFVAASGDQFSRSRFLRDYDTVVRQSPHSQFTNEYRDLIARYLDPIPAPFGLDELKIDASRFLFEFDGVHGVVSYVYLRSFPWAEGAVDRLYDTMHVIGFDELEGTSIVGGGLGSGGHSKALTRDLFRALSVVVILVSALLLFQFRSTAAASLCLIPAICGVAAVLVAMAVLRVELNMLTLSIAPLVVGIGLDDGIHVVERLRRGQTKEGILREAGSSMLMTTVTTVAAFACMGLAKFGGVQELGILGAVGLTVSFFSAVHLVPILHGYFTSSRMTIENGM